MGRTIVIAALAAGAGLLGSVAPASAQQQPLLYPPPVGRVDAPLEAASPDGAVYIPGVGFRYVAPGGPRVYGYYYRAYGPRAYGYRARRACADRGWWLFDRCGRRGW
jgi:hypothetical protein